MDWYFWLIISLIALSIVFYLTRKIWLLITAMLFLIIGLLIDPIIDHFYEDDEDKFTDEEINELEKIKEKYIKRSS